MGKRNTQTPNNNTKPESRSNTIERKNSRREKNCCVDKQSVCQLVTLIISQYDVVVHLVWCRSFCASEEFFVGISKFNSNIHIYGSHIFSSMFSFCFEFDRFVCCCLRLFFHIIQLVKNRIPFKNLCCIRFPYIYWTFKVNKNTDEFFECSITIIIWFERTAKSTTNDGPNATKIMQQKSLTNHSINIHDVLIVRLWEIQQKKIYFNVFVLSNASLNVIQMEWMKIGEWRLSELSQKWFWNKKHSFFSFFSIFDLFFVYTFFCTTWIISRSGMGKKLFTNM